MSERCEWTSKRSNDWPRGGEVEGASLGRRKLESLAISFAYGTFNAKTTKPADNISSILFV